LTSAKSCPMFETYYKQSSEERTETCIAMSGKLQDILIRHWLFGVLPGRVIADLSYQFSTRKYSDKQYVFHQGDKAAHLFVILEGEVSIEIVNLDGKVTKISHLNQGEIFGEFALIDGEGRSASAKIVKPALIASLTSNVFSDLIEHHTSFSKKLMAVLVSRLRGTNRQVESIVTKTLLQRTAQILLDLSKTTGNEIRITQSELATRLHATREKVNTKLKELEQIGAIKTGHGKIVIKNIERLHKGG